MAQPPPSLWDWELSQVEKEQLQGKYFLVISYTNVVLFFSAKLCKTPKNLTSQNGFILLQNVFTIPPENPTKLTVNM